jgi:hypothetical protein
VALVNPEKTVVIFIGLSGGLWLQNGMQTTEMRTAATAQPAITSMVRRIYQINCKREQKFRLTKTLSDAPPRAPDCNRDATGAFAAAKVRLTGQHVQ